MATRKAAPYKHVDKVGVFLWDQHIGSAALDPAFGYYAFAYTDAFRKSGIEPSPLHMPVSESPDGHFKFPHLWPLKLPQTGRSDYGFPVPV